MTDWVSAWGDSAAVGEVGIGDNSDHSEESRWGRVKAVVLGAHWSDIRRESRLGDGCTAGGGGRAPTSQGRVFTDVKTWQHI